jgi:hypothetical protein
MSDGIRVSLTNDNVAYAGVVSFDGETFEALGIQLPVKPSGDETVALQDLVAAVQSGIDGKAGA